MFQIGVHVQDRVGIRPAAINHRVQRRLGGRLLVGIGRAPVKICFEQIGPCHHAFVEPAGRNQHARRAPVAHAEVAAGRRNPAARIAPSRRGTQRFRFRLDVERIGDHR